MHKDDLYPFIVIEGIDGAGTSTQCKLLVEALKAEGINAEATEEPTPGPIGRLIREGLGNTGSSFHHASMSLLFAADRIEHIESMVRPAIESQTAVISDRYLASSMAYQGLWEDTQWIQMINSRAIVPSLMIFVDVDTAVAEQRRNDRGGEPEIYETKVIQEKVAQKYKEVLEELSNWTRTVVVNGNSDIEQVRKDIWLEVKPLFPNAN